MMQVLKALSSAYGGYSIARDNGKVVFLKGAIPGETVEAEILERKRDYSVAAVVSVMEPSEHRVLPPCPVFGTCGGCQLQYISYEKQVALKDEVLLDSLQRLGGIETGLGPALSGGQWKYRHRAQFKVSRGGEVGFFRESSRDVIGVEECPLLTDGLNLILRKIREMGLARSFSDVHVAGGDTPVALLRGGECDQALFEHFVEAGLSGIAFDDSIVYGGDYTGFDLNGFRYTVSPWTFFQAHWELNQRVSSFLNEGLMPFEGQSVLDLYAGAGNFSLPLARAAKEVVAVEENPHAVEDGVRNAELNDVRNCRFIKSSAEKYRMTRKFDILLLDPPRPGLTSEVAQRILENPPGRIAYISCNPATLARDLKKLKQKYEILSVCQIDFFPNTFHIEAVAFLSLR